MPVPNCKNTKIIINSLESVGMEGTRGFGWPWLVFERWKRNNKKLSWKETIP
jgi:hypothetical protein